MARFVGVLFLVVLGLIISSGGWAEEEKKETWRIHTLFSVECQNYFDWQTVGLMHSYKKAQQPGPITRLLSCTDEEKKNYKGMNLAPTFEVPSMSRHPKTGDWYPAINKPAGVVHWLKHSKDAENVDWVVILDADQIIRGPIIPWELGAEKGRPVAAYYGYLVGCDNLLAKLHTKHPELCDKVGGLLAMHIDDLRALAPMWLSKTEEVREDRAHWTTNLTGDIYGKGWISEMYGYSFGAAEVGLRHKINDNVMIYPGYIPRTGVEPILLHYGLPFRVGNWSFSKLDHHEDDIVYDCSRLFSEPPYPREVRAMEADPNKRRALFLNLECINTLNEGLLLQHAAHGCPKPKWSRYLSFLKSKTFAELTGPKSLTPETRQIKEAELQEPVVDESERPHPKIHTIFSTECTPYFDWQTVGLVHSFHRSGQPGNITRLLSCTDEDLKEYKGHDLAPTHYVPSMSRHPLTGDWYPAINKPAAVLHWLNHGNIDAEFIVILDADMIMRGTITPWEFKAARGRPVSTPYDYLIGCHNELAKLHTSHPEACDKVGGVIIMHIDDLRKFALLWLHKTEEVRADTAHYGKNITGDIFESGWISEMYGYSFGAAELNLRHIINSEILIYPGYVPQPGVKYRVFHYGLEYTVGNWSFDKANWRTVDVVQKCWAKFPDPPDPSTLDGSDENILQRDLLSIECAKTLNEALRLHHERKCSDTNSLSTSNSEKIKEVTISGKVGKIDATRSNTVPVNDSQEASLPVPDEAHGSFRFWIITLWVSSIFSFVAVMFVLFFGRKGQKKRGKSYKTKRRSSYSGLRDMNGYDRHLATMQGGFRAILSHGSLLKKAVLQRVRLVNPVMQPLLFSRHESVSAARIEEHGFESTTISDIMKAKGKSADGSWLWCTTDDSVYDAVKSMTQHNVGALVVVRPGEQKLIAGIITERDYLRKIIVQGRSSKSTKVGDIMTEENKLITVSPDTKVLKAMQLMTDNRIRHIPVIDHEGMIGMVSIGDVVRAVVSEHRDELNRLNAFIQGGY